MKIVDNKLYRESNSHFNLNGKAKIKFNTEAEAVIKCYEINITDSQKYKMVSYYCPICKHWHIGNSRNFLSSKEKKKLIVKYKEIRIKLGL